MSSFKDAVTAFYTANDEGNTDLLLLGTDLQPQDSKADYLQNRDTYCWYHALAYKARPKVIAEIGSRFGYSLKAMIYGAGRYRSQKDLIVFSFDNESYEPNCLSIICNMLTYTDVGEYVIAKQDSQAVNVLPLQRTGRWDGLKDCGGELTKADLFHVDGDHSIQGTLHDLLLAKDQLAEGGIILLDDIDTKECPGVKAALLLFIGDNPEFTWDYFPSYRGLAAIYRSSELKEFAS